VAQVVKEPVLQVQSPEFKFQSHPKKKKHLGERKLVDVFATLPNHLAYNLVQISHSISNE
jgi:hypothetical protein